MPKISDKGMASSSVSSPTAANAMASSVKATRRSRQVQPTETRPKLLNHVHTFVNFALMHVLGDSASVNFTCGEPVTETFWQCLLSRRYVHNNVKIRSKATCLPIRTPSVGAVKEWPPVPALLVIDSFTPHLRGPVLEQAVVHRPGVWVLKQHVGNPQESVLEQLRIVARLHRQIHQRRAECYTKRVAGRQRHGM